MYTKEEASQLRSEFWTTFGKYLSPHLSADGMKVNWINYKTGIKHVYFRMNANFQYTSIAIELTQPDIEIQQLYFEHFQSMKEVLESSLEEAWDWELHVNDEHGKIISRIVKELPSVNIFNKNDWPTLISFFKPRLLALDQFWCDAKDSFDELR